MRDEHVETAGKWGVVLFKDQKKGAEGVEGKMKLRKKMKGRRKTMTTETMPKMNKDEEKKQQQKQHTCVDRLGLMGWRCQRQKQITTNDRGGRREGEAVDDVYFVTHGCSFLCTMVDGWSDAKDECIVQQRQVNVRTRMYGVWLL